MLLAVFSGTKNLSTGMLREFLSSGIRYSVNDILNLFPITAAIAAACVPAKVCGRRKTLF